jgi:enoyl reductase-like protein
MQYERLSHNEEDIWTDPDEIIEVRRSNLRRARNAHLLIGSGFGAVGTIAIQYVILWVLNVV